MNSVEIYNELDNFYKIRSDTYGKKYIQDFLRIVIDEKLPIENYMKWFNKNKNKFGQKYEKSTLKSYQRVLSQFIRYLNLIKETNSTMKLKNNNTKKRKPTKIHDTFQSFQSSNK